MASQIVAHHPKIQGSAFKPHFSPRASLPCDSSDVVRAVHFTLGGIRVVGDGHEPDIQVFDFKNSEGSWASYTEEELRSCTWWYWLPEEQVQCIEAFLFPLPSGEARVWYVARSAEGGRLIRDSRLSRYFLGAGARDAAHKEQEKLREVWRDVAVFEADSVEVAERVLAARAPSDEGLTIRLEQMAAARVARFAEASHA